MWNPGFAFCPGCCPEDPCVACLAGGTRHSCLTVTVSGVSGSTGDGDCSLTCGDLINGTYHLFESGEYWNASGSGGPMCRWSSGTPSCGEDCVGRVHAELYLAKQGTDNLVVFEVTAKPHTAGATTEVLQFVRNVGVDAPNCYFDELELFYDAAASSPTNCDFAGATCHVSVEQGHRCTPFREVSSNTFPWMACHKGEIPWQGVIVELSGFGSAECDECAAINGTYLCSGPPQRIQTPNPSVYGWEVVLPEPAGCQQINAMQVSHLFVALSVAGVEANPGPRLHVAGPFDTSPLFMSPDEFFQGTCHCQEGQDMTAFPDDSFGAVFRGCQDGTVHIEPF